MTAAAEETFLQRQKRLKAEREAAERGYDAPPWADSAAEGRVVEAGSPRAQAWVQAKLDAQLAEVAARPEGDRNAFLNNVAYSLGRLAPKWVDPHEVAPRLLEAALASGLGHGEATATINSGLTSGMREPRDPPVDDDVPNPDSAESFAELWAGSASQMQTDGAESAADSPPKPTLHEQMVAKELAVLRAREEARRVYAAERAAAEFRVPPSVPTLREQLKQPREATRYAIESVLPVHGNALLTAQYKTGKTTLVTALLKAFADGEPFLGRFGVNPQRGRIAIWNYELSQAQYDEWLEQAGIVNQEAVSVLHLRGFRLPLTAPKVEDWCVGWLREHDVSVWIADPFARASVGVDENSNTEVGVWLDTFDVIKARAEVREGILPTHTGRAEQEAGQERARGATRLDDWADVRWLLTKDEEGNRFFRATGRDVDVPEEKLSYDPATRALSIGGGDRAWVKRRALEEAVVAFVRANPGATSAVVEKGVEGRAEGVRSALRAAVADHRIRVEEGPKNARLHHAN